MSLSQSSHSAGVALYYPYIHISNLHWLKLSLLYFDSVRRIVPENTVLKDSPQIRRIVDCGLLNATYPNRYATAASNKFKNSVISLWQQGNPKALEVLNRASKAFIDNSISTSSLHLEKMTDGLAWQLQSLGVARQTGDWLELDAQIAGAYMMCLASVMSRSINTPLITDNPYYKGFGEYLMFGKTSSNSTKSLSSVLLKLGIQFPTYEALKSVSTDKIISFHEQYRDERQCFRETIETISNRVRYITDPHELTDFINDKKKEIESAIKDYEKTIFSLNIKALGSFLSISAPTAITSVAGIITGTIASPLAAGLLGGGIALGLAQWWAGVNLDHRAAVSDTSEKHRQWHYLLAMRDTFVEPSPWENEIGGTLGTMP